MAKKDEEKNIEKDKEIKKGEEKKQEKNKKEKKSKKNGCLIKIVFFIIIIGILVWILGFNAFNIRDKYLRSGLEKIPIIKNILPPVEEKKEEKIAQKSENEKTIDELTKTIDEQNKEIQRLQVFEKSQLQFKKDKEEFDKMVALKEPKEYVAYYEKISPENAEKLYTQSIEKTKKDKKFKEYIKTFEAMKKEEVSAILEELLLTDTDLVITILENVSSEKRAEMLGAMSPKNASTCSRLLSPK